MGINVFAIRRVSCRQKPEKLPLAGTLRVPMPVARALLVQASLQRTAQATAIKCLRHFTRRRAINHNKQTWHARSQRSPSAQTRTLERMLAMYRIVRASLTYLASHKPTLALTHIAG